MNVGQGTWPAKKMALKAPTRNQRHILFALFLLVALSPFWAPLRALVELGLEQDYCSQILIIPFIALALVYWRRHVIFRDIRAALVIGTPICSVGLLVAWLALRYGTPGSYNSLSTVAFGLVLICIAGFVAIYGLRATRAAAFPLGFLFLAVPIPSFFLDRSIFYLQFGSTTAAQGLFRMLGVPLFRQGFSLAVPGLTIQVAQECSSIRSSIVLVITCLLAGYLFLRSPWRRTLLVLLAIPLSVLKNGVRIVTLVLLSLHVNPAFMTGRLHHEGGILFYLLAILILFPIFRWLENSEKNETQGPSRKERNSAQDAVVGD